MKKMAIIILGICMLANTACCGTVLKLTAYGKVVSPVEVLKRGQVYGAFLVEMQGILYAVEDTPLYKVRRMHIKEGSEVIVGIWLDENDKLCKLYIME